MPEQLDRAALKALGADTRQQIVKALERRPHTASELSKVLGKHVTTVSEHLDVLEQGGLVARREDGHKWVYYVLSDKGAKLFKPKFYSWTVLLAVSVVMIAAGGMLTGFTGGAQSVGTLREAAGAEALVTEPGAMPPLAGAPPAAAPLGGDLIAMAGLALLALGLFGAAMAGVKLRAARKTENVS